MRLVMRGGGSAWLRVLAVLVVWVCAPAWAVNKCTGADGKVTYQQAACPTSAKDQQQIKTWVNRGYEPQKMAAGVLVEPNLKLAGPPQAAPLLALYRRWADAERLALSTSRVALAGPAAGLQGLQREAEALQAPQCLADARKALLALVTKSTEAILQFLGKEELTAMVYQRVSRPGLIQDFEKAVAAAQCE